MEVIKEMQKQILDLTKRIESLEKLIPSKKQPDIVKKDTSVPYIEPKDIPENSFTYTGRYSSLDGKSGSEFGGSCNDIHKAIFENNYNVSELSNIINAFATEERINIIKCLLQKRLTAKQLMEELKFKTTGKLYHHLTILENLGIIFKQNETYIIQGYAIGHIILILDSAARLLDRFKNN